VVHSVHRHASLLNYSPINIQNRLDEEPAPDDEDSDFIYIPVVYIQ